MSAKSEQRRTLIAEAAIAILARQGARGLTHRAVDSELSLPDGSTSYYHPTRSALLLAAAQRLVELDTADVGAIASRLDGVVTLVQRWLSAERRTRSLARMELLLSAARDPAFSLMQQVRETFVERIARAGASRASAAALVALVDGLVLHGLVVGPLRRSDVRSALERVWPGEIHAASPKPKRVAAESGKRVARR